jgi:hypothetical protein
MRDLTMPGSPKRRTVWPSPSLARDYRRSNSSISSSRPTRGPSEAARNASKRLSTALGRSACQTCTAPAAFDRNAAEIAMFGQVADEAPCPSEIITAPGSAKPASGRQDSASRRLHRAPALPRYQPDRRPHQARRNARAASERDGRSRPQRGNRADELQRCHNRAFSVGLVRLRVAEIDQHPIAHVFRDIAVENRPRPRRRNCDTPR